MTISLEGCQHDKIQIPISRKTNFKKPRDNATLYLTKNKNKKKKCTKYNLFCLSDLEQKSKNKTQEKPNQNMDSNQ